MQSRRTKIAKEVKRTTVTRIHSKTLQGTSEVLGVSCQASTGWSSPRGTSTPTSPCSILEPERSQCCGDARKKKKKPHWEISGNSQSIPLPSQAAILSLPGSKIRGKVKAEPSPKAKAPRYRPEQVQHGSDTRRGPARFPLSAAPGTPRGTVLAGFTNNFIQQQQNKGQEQQQGSLDSCLYSTEPSTPALPWDKTPP